MAEYIKNIFILLSPYLFFPFVICLFPRNHLLHGAQFRVKTKAFAVLSNAALPLLLRLLSVGLQIVVAARLPTDQFNSLSIEVHISKIAYEIIASDHWVQGHTNTCTLKWYMYLYTHIQATFHHLLLGALACSCCLLLLLFARLNGPPGQLMGLQDCCVAVVARWLVVWLVGCCHCIALVQHCARMAAGRRRQPLTTLPIMLLTRKHKFRRCCTYTRMRTQPHTHTYI